MFTFVSHVATSEHASNSFCTQNIWVHSHCVWVRVWMCVCVTNCLMEEENITDWGEAVASLCLNRLDEFFWEDPRVIFYIPVLVPALLPDPLQQTFLLRDTDIKHMEDLEKTHPPFDQLLCEWVSELTFALISCFLGDWHKYLGLYSVMLSWGVLSGTKEIPAFSFKSQLQSC